MKVLRNAAVTLMILLLLTSCGGKQNEQEENENTNKQQSIQLQVDDPEVQKIVMEILESKKWNLQNESIEEYAIISVCAGNTPATNGRGGKYQDYYYNFISFCYEKSNRVYFQTVSTDNNKNSCDVVVCQLGIENKVTIISGEVGGTARIYCFTLTKETYESIYNS